MAQNEATLWIKIKEVGAEVLDRLVFTLDDVISLLEAVPKAVMATIDAYREQESAIKELNQAMVNQGTFTGELQAQYIELASALQQVTTYGDEQIVSAEAILQAHIGNKKVTEELVTATLNLATAKKMDLNSAAELIGKTISSENNLLSRQGIVIDEVALKNDRLGAVIDAVNSRYKDYATSASQGLGATKQLSNAFSDLLEIVGEKLAPQFEYVSIQLTGLFRNMAEWAGKSKDVKTSTSDLEKELGKLEEKITSLAGKKVTISMGLGSWEQDDPELIKAQERHKILLDEITKQKQMESQAALMGNEKNQQEALALEQRNFEEMSALKLAQNQLDLANIGANDAQKIANQIAFLDTQIKNEEDFHTKKNLTQQKFDLQAQQLKQKQHDQDLKDFDSFLNTTATLSRSSNQTLMAIGKAAAITQIAIKTPEAVASSFAFGTRIGGPPRGFLLGVIAPTAMAAQAAQVAGVQLAEGGIVRARPGGINATIGEGGQDEAVIPLDRAGDFGLGGGGSTTINFNGPILGDRNQAREFARAIDRELTSLARDGESTFIEGVV